MQLPTWGENGHIKAGLAECWGELGTPITIRKSDTKERFCWDI